jgi:hypothetical protein
MAQLKVKEINVNKNEVFAILVIPNMCIPAYISSDTE